MKPTKATVVLLAALAVAPATSAPAQDREAIVITRASARTPIPVRGANFTGTVRVQPLFDTTATVARDVLGEPRR